MMRFVLSLAVILGASLFASTARAEQVQICNQTSHILMLSFGIVKHDKTASSVGWRRLLPGSCERPNLPYSRAGELYVHGSSHNAHGGEKLLFEGEAHFCVDATQPSFNIDGQQDCFLRGFSSADFAQVDLSARLPSIYFSSTENYSQRRARVAGAQRLLLEADYDIGRVDGFASATTMNALNQMRRSKNLPLRRLIYEADIRALLAEVELLNRERGLELCNRTNRDIWAAVGFVSADNFESQGWLKLVSQQCRQAVNDELSSRYYFVYAESRAPQADTIGFAAAESATTKRNYWGGDFMLCTKPTRFVIMGRDSCAARGYVETGFLRLDTGRATKWEHSFEDTPR